MFGRKKTVPIDALQVEPPPYPLDDTFIGLYQLYLQGSLAADFAAIELEGIVPHTDYVPPLVDAFVAGVRAAIEQDQPPVITVYPRGEQFVMCDDYHLFYAYRQLGAEAIFCYVLGPAS